MDADELQLRNGSAARLRAERVRLSFTPEKFAEHGGVHRSSVFNYEAGSRVPDALFLMRLRANAGVDVLYVLTGERTPSDAAKPTVESVTCDFLAAIREEQERFSARQEELDRQAAQATAAFTAALTALRADLKTRPPQGEAMTPDTDATATALFRQCMCRIAAFIALILLACVLLAGCGGGDAEDDEVDPAPPVNCKARPELCR